jgi:hypothetical protein
MILSDRILNIGRFLMTASESVEPLSLTDRRGLTMRTDRGFISAWKVSSFNWKVSNSAWKVSNSNCRQYRRKCADKG